MAFTQHIVTYPDFLAAGGTAPANYRPTDTTVVIVCTDDTSGAVVWASFDEATVPVAERLNPTVAAKDWRP